MNLTATGSRTSGIAIGHKIQFRCMFRVRNGKKRAGDAGHGEVDLPLGHGVLPHHPQLHGGLHFLFFTRFRSTLVHPRSTPLPTLRFIMVRIIASWIVGLPDFLFPRF